MKHKSISKHILLTTLIFIVAIAILKLSVYYFGKNPQPAESKVPDIIGTEIVSAEETVPSNIETFATKLGSSIERYHADVEKKQFLSTLIWNKPIKLVPSIMNQGTLKEGHGLIGVDWDSDGAIGQEIFSFTHSSIAGLTSRVFPEAQYWTQTVLESLRFLKALDTNDANVTMFVAGDFGEMAISIAISYRQEVGSDNMGGIGLRMVIYGADESDSPLGGSATPRISLNLSKYEEVLKFQQELRNQVPYSKENIVRIVPEAVQEVMEIIARLED